MHTALAIIVAFVSGIWLGWTKAGEAGDERVRKLELENVKHTERVSNDWARAVDYLVGRIRNGFVPRIPAPVPPSPQGGSTVSPDGRPADPVPAATGVADLAACRAEREQLINDCQRTTLQLRGLQTWAK